MNINSILKRMSSALTRKQDALFTYDTAKQKRYIEKLGEPRDNLERSYFQYKCQMKFNGVFLTFLLNIASFPVALLYLAKYSERGKTVQLRCADMVFFRDGKPANILPESLRNKYADIEENPKEGILLTKEDRKFIWSIARRFPLSWHLILKCIIKIGRYSCAIAKYSPSAIAVCAEYSFTSSALTQYCARRGIKHIDVMHGEKLYYMRDSFFKFDECYVWDDFYAELLASMKAAKEQFRTEIPPSMNFSGSLERTHEYDYTYYLGAENEETLKKIASSLKALSRQDKKICVRPHPRYSDISAVKRIFDFAEIEDTKSVTVEKTLMRTRYAVSMYSTVLNQAVCNGIDIAIDDVSNPKKFAKLKELDYVCLNKKHKLLSQITEEK